MENTKGQNKRQKSVRELSIKCPSVLILHCKMVPYIFVNRDISVQCDGKICLIASFVDRIDQKDIMQ